MHWWQRRRLVAQVRDMADGSAVWIAKPSITNQATGICIFDRAGTLRAALEASEDLREWVLQRYTWPGASAAHLAVLGLLAGCVALPVRVSRNRKARVRGASHVRWPAIASLTRPTSKRVCEGFHVPGRVKATSLARNRPAAQYFWVLIIRCAVAQIHRQAAAGTRPQVPHPRLRALRRQPCCPRLQVRAGRRPISQPSKHLLRLRTVALTQPAGVHTCSTKSCAATLMHVHTTAPMASSHVVVVPWLFLSLHVPATCCAHAFPFALTWPRAGCAARRWRCSRAGPTRARR